MDRNENQNSFKNWRDSRENAHELNRLRRKNRIFVAVCIALAGVLVGTVGTLVLRNEDRGIGSPGTKSVGQAESGSSSASVDVGAAIDSASGSSTESSYESASSLSVLEEVTTAGSDLSEHMESISNCENTAVILVESTAENPDSAAEAFLEYTFVVDDYEKRSEIEERLSILLQQEFEMTESQYVFGRLAKGSSEGTILAASGEDAQSTAFGFEKLIVAGAVCYAVDLGEYNGDSEALLDLTARYLGRKGNFGKTWDPDGYEDAGREMIRMLGAGVSGGAGGTEVHTQSIQETDSLYQAGVNYVRRFTGRYQTARFKELGSDDTVLTPMWCALLYSDISQGSNQSSKYLSDILRRDTAGGMTEESSGYPLKDGLITELESTYNNKNVFWYQDITSSSDGEHEKLAVCIEFSDERYVFVLFTDGSYNRDLGADLSQLIETEIQELREAT